MSWGQPQFRPHLGVYTFLEHSEQRVVPSFQFSVAAPQHGDWLIAVTSLVVAFVAPARCRMAPCTLQPVPLSSTVIGRACVRR